MSYYYNDNSTTTTIAPSAALLVLVEEAATIAANVTTTLTTNASDTAATATTQDAEDITEESNFDPTIMILVFGIVIGLWCFAVCLTTKGCTDCEYKIDGGDYDDDENGVWGGMMSPQEQRDAILARRLQRLEDDASPDATIISPQDLEQARQEWEQKAILRSAYLETIIPLKPDGNNNEATSAEEIRHLPQQQPQQQSTITDNQEVVVEEEECYEDPENNNNNNRWRCTICLESSPKDTTTVKDINSANPNPDQIGGDSEVVIIVQSTSKLCKHSFHRQCIASWLISNKDCPICRQCYLKEDYLVVEQQQQQQRENKGVIGGSNDDEQQPKGYVPPLASSASPLLNDNNDDLTNNANLDIIPTTTTAEAAAAAAAANNNNNNSWFQNFRTTIANFQFYRP